MWSATAFIPCGNVSFFTTREHRFKPGTMVATKPLLLALMLLLPSAHGLAFTTANHDLSTTLWDTWLYCGPDGWVLNYLAAHKSTHMWNSLGTALSSDGVHFADAGISVRKDCASSPNDWEVTPSQTRGQNGATIWNWDVLCSQHLGCRVPTVPTKTRLESSTRPVTKQ